MKPDIELDEEQELDRQYFAENPGRRIYVRPARGWEASQGGDLTIVAEVRPGLRVRVPFRVNPLIYWPALNEDEDELRDMLRASPMAAVLRAALGGL